MTNNIARIETSHRVRGLLEKRNITQEQLAEARGVARPTITQKLSGSVGWTSEDYRFMSYYFQCSVDYLMGLTDEPRRNSETVPFQVGA